MQNVPEAAGDNGRGTRHKLLVFHLTADRPMRAVKQNLHARARQALALEHPALQARDVRHAGIEHLEERPAQALRVTCHQRQKVNAHLNCLEVGCLAQGDRILYVLVHFHVVVACGSKRRQ